MIAIIIIIMAHSILVSAISAHIEDESCALGEIPNMILLNFNIQ